MYIRLLRKQYTTSQWRRQFNEKVDCVGQFERLIQKVDSKGWFEKLIWNVELGKLGDGWLNNFEIGYDMKLSRSG